MRWSIVPGVDGVHDMGGMQGFGPVVWPGADDPYHERVGAADPRAERHHRVRAAARLERPGADREEMPPAEYLGAGYFDRWV